MLHGCTQALFILIPTGDTGYPLVKLLLHRYGASVRFTPLRRCEISSRITINWLMTDQLSLSGCETGGFNCLLYGTCS